MSSIPPTATEAPDGSAEMTASVRLDRFNNAWFDPGAGTVRRTLWVMASAAFFQSWFPWPNGMKAAVLRAFGARIGPGAVIKPRVTIKYPWNLSVGEYVWLGEGVWIDNLALVTIGGHSCLSQAVMIETGNHDWSDPCFGLRIGPVTIGEGAWLAVRSTLLPGATVGRNAVVGAGVVVSGAIGEATIVSSAHEFVTRNRKIAAGNRPRQEGG